MRKLFFLFTVKSLQKEMGQQFGQLWKKSRLHPNTDAPLYHLWDPGLIPSPLECQFPWLESGNKISFLALRSECDNACKMLSLRPGTQ